MYVRMVGDKMAKKRTNKKVKRRLMLLGVGSLAIITFTLITIGKYWVEIYQKYKESKELDEKLISLKDEEEELKVDVEKLQDPDYVARFAREKYLYSKDGEFILRIP